MQCAVVCGKAHGCVRQCSSVRSEARQYAAKGITFSLIKHFVYYFCTRNNVLEHFNLACMREVQPPSRFANIIEAIRTSLKQHH